MVLRCVRASRARELRYKDLYGKKTYRFCNLRKWKDFNKNGLPYLQCVLRLSCVVHGPIYGRCNVTVTQQKLLNRWKLHNKAVSNLCAFPKNIGDFTNQNATQPETSPEVIILVLRATRLNL